MRDSTILVLIWLVATACNLDKAYHIDDTAHLEIAAWITAHPGAPMSGLVNWSDSARPIHELNQPSLYFYILAGWGRIFGYGETAMHALQSLFTLAATLFFFGIARIVVPPYAIILTALLILGPAFVVGQNLMVDIPILACSLAFFYLLLKPDVRSEHTRYTLAALTASAAVLMKYSCLPLLPLLLIHIVARKQLRVLYALLIPLAILTAWSLFNYFEYGSVHLLDRPSQARTFERTSSMGLRWVIALGSIAPFSVLVLADTLGRMRKWTVSRRAFTIAGALVSIVVATLYLRNRQPYPHALLAALFVVNGAYLLVAAGLALRAQNPRPAPLLYLWLAAVSGFIVLFAPFLATRHVLLSVPPLLLILGTKLPARPRPRAAFAAILATVFLSANLVIADWRFADYYRRQAPVIRAALPSESTVWFTGHWGWQWYAKKNGMRQIDLRRSRPEPEPGSRPGPGDYIVRPLAIHQQEIDPELRLELHDVISDPPVERPRFNTANGSASFYSAHYLPWTINREPFGSIEIYRITGVTTMAGPPPD
ncbi:MAG: hypothetical protein HKN20_17770 [Gemmatimonadetes bacterium]|nr:hypothetical protein [Gemmatimonadota bacterium]